MEPKRTAAVQLVSYLLGTVRNAVERDEYPTQRDFHPPVEVALAVLITFSLTRGSFRDRTERRQHFFPSRSVSCGFAISS